MKRLILTAAACLALAGCGGGARRGGAAEQPHKTRDCVEVLYFHGRQRCATCQAIETNAREAVEACFADKLASGEVVFRTVDLSEAANGALAERYGVTWSSLFVCRWRGGEERFEDLTEYAFAKARTAPEEFRRGVVGKVESMLE